INTNPANPIINVRAFSEDKKLVSSMSNALIKGIQRWNMIATSKHFPGHGNTNVDSHSDIPIIPSSLEELNKTELIPFKSNIDNGILSVMVGHLAIPSIDQVVDLPASLSTNIVTGLLKDEMKFNGLIVTDAMNMNSITKYYSTADAAIKAIEAGNDVLLFPKNEDEAYDALVFAVQSGQIRESRIEESVRKILLAKRWTGIDKQRFVDINKITERVGTKEHWEVSKQLAQKSITLVRNDQKLIPIQNSHKTKYYHIALLDNNRDAVADNFGNMLKQRIPELTSTSLPLKSRRKDYIDVLKDVAKNDIIFLSTYTKVRDGRGSIGLIKEQESFINDLLRTKKKIVFLAHGNPYILSGFPKV
ncbi:MAG: glycoside hydrolase family 3 N-terminal domain-containing protein, partial [Ignavibacteriaceae bacterium]|nr:glycoside hydrolase family 3 N-terminal domain-containing protein [Ignavibacteriaceae bacterium]